MLIVLVVVSAYSDIPQLEPVRKQMESFKIQLQSSMESPPLHIEQVTPRIEQVTIGDIIRDPEAYVDTENYVSVKGQLSSIWHQTEDGEYCKWSLVDEQKFGIILAPPLPYEDSRAYSLYETYRVKGKVTYLTIITYTFSGRTPKTVLVLEPIEMTKL
jgi:hypothetical protein